MKKIVLLAALFLSLGFGRVSAQTDYSQILLLMQYLNKMGYSISSSDLDYLQNTLYPLYQYTTEEREVPAETKLDFQLDTIAAAPKDGLYYGLGNYYNTYNAAGYDYDDEVADAMYEYYGVKYKTNGAYIWGLVTAKDKIFWGTVNNILCMPSWQNMTSLSSNQPYANTCWVCEYAKGTRKDAGTNGDIERPRCYMYDTKTGVVKDITPSTTKAPVLDDCLGLRSAAYHNGVVFLGGPGLDSDMGQTSTKSAFLAFDEDGKYLASSDMTNVDGCTVTDVRRWIVVDDVLYCGVAVTTADGVNKGAILRWYGDKSDPFQFHIVGWTANEAGEICEHNGRLYAGGWPTTNLQQPAIFEGPEIPEGGLTPEDAKEWEIKWRMSEYENCPINLRMEQCSLLRSYKGQLYWSIWYVQYGTLPVLQNLGCDLASMKGMASLMAIMRQATLWRTKDFSEVELLYGEEELPTINMQTMEPVVPQPTGWKPKYGRAGFGRYFTAYMWASAEYNDKLYIGTMSTEQLLKPAQETATDLSTQYGLSAISSILGVKEESKGYELYVFDDNDSEPTTVTQDGFGNHAQYGIRNMVTNNDGSDLYIGTASPFNLNRYGGWRLLRLHDNDYVAPPVTGVEQAQAEPLNAGVLVKHEEGYVVLSSLLDERIESVTVCDVAGREVYSEQPVNREAYIFTSQTGGGVRLITVKTKSGSWTAKVVM